MKYTVNLRKSQFFPLVYLVPEQASFKQSMPWQGISTGWLNRAQVFGLNVWPGKLRGNGRKTASFIDDTGKSMMMLRILEENKHKLQLLNMWTSSLELWKILSGFIMR